MSTIEVITGAIRSCEVAPPAPAEPGVAPASRITFTIAVNLGNGGGPVVWEGQTPWSYRWPESIDTNGQAMVGKMVLGVRIGGKVWWLFVEPPAVRDCSAPLPAPITNPDVPPPINPNFIGVGGSISAANPAGSEV